MMKVAIASDNGSVSGHFGFCEGFTVYEIKDGDVLGSNYIVSPGHKPGVLPKLLKDAGAEVVIAGGMGEHAQSILTQNGIEVMVGVEGECSAVIKEFCAGTLISKPEVCHEHAHSHDCGEHEH